MVYDRYLAVLGPHFRDGREYFFADFRGRPDARGNCRCSKCATSTATARARSSPASAPARQAEWRETLTVLAMGAGDAPFVMFQHEVGIHGAGGTLANEVRFGRRGAAPASRSRRATPWGTAPRPTAKLSRPRWIRCSSRGGESSHKSTHGTEGLHQSARGATSPLFELSAPPLG